MVGILHSRRFSDDCRSQAGHLPIGQFSWSIRLLTLVKQPQILQRTPVWCSQAAQVCSRLPLKSRRAWS